MGKVSFGRRPTAIGRKFFIKYFNLVFVILGLSFKLQTYILSNGWDSLTNHCFFGPRPRPNRTSAEKNGRKKNFGPNGWKAAELLDRLLHTESQSYRVTELQSYRVTESHHFHSLYRWVNFFLCPFSINSPPRFAHRGINSPTRFARRGIKYLYPLPTHQSPTQSLFYFPTHRIKTLIFPSPIIKL